MTNHTIENVKCTDISDCKTYTVVPSERLDYSKKSATNNFANAHLGKTISIQDVSNKIQRIYGLGITTCKWNLDNKSFDMTIIENSKIKEVKTISYDEICKTLWWHSFEIVGQDSIVPNKFTFEEREAIEAPKVKASEKKMKQYLIEHPEVNSPNVPEDDSLPEDDTLNDEIPSYDDEKEDNEDN